MDTFDIRKYITENRINEMEFRIIVKDGDDFQEAFYSRDALKKKYPKGKKLEQGGIVHGYESLSGQRINESDMGDAVEFYMDYYDENEMPQEIRDAIADALEDGKSLEFIKAQIKNGFEDMVLPEGISEQEDVLEPEEGADKKPEQEENDFYYDEETRTKNKEAAKKQLKDILVKAKENQDKVKVIDTSFIISELSKLINSEFMDNIVDTANSDGLWKPFISNVAYLYGEKKLSEKDMPNIKKYSSDFYRFLGSSGIKGLIAGIEGAAKGLKFDYKYSYEYLDDE